MRIIEVCRTCGAYGFAAASDAALVPLAPEPQAADAALFPLTPQLDADVTVAEESVDIAVATASATSTVVKDVATAAPEGLISSPIDLQVIHSSVGEEVDTRPVFQPTTRSPKALAISAAVVAALTVRRRRRER